MSSGELRKKFLEFFKNRGHKIVPSSSLIPDDPSVLLTTAGMQQFKKYYTGNADPIKDFGSKNTVSVQKSFRTSDIDEVGDDSHLTFFEMLGNFSFGGYFKEDAIKCAKEFIESLGLEIEYVTVFGGDEKTPSDKESEEIWRNLGVEDIRKAGREDNFWGPTGAEGPCGPTTEIYINGVEIWNIVFNEYYKKPDGTFEKLKTSGVDTGMGLERLAMVSQNKKNIFETDLFDFLMREFPDNLPTRTRRIIADHIRAIAFLVSDGVRPSNKEAGYILRRLLRRVIAFAEMGNIGRPPEDLLKLVVGAYKTFPDYKNLDFTAINKIYKEEYTRFLETVGHGRKEFEKEADKIKEQKIYLIPRVFAFNLFQSAGITIDILDDFAKKEGVKIDKKAFAEDFEKHQEISRVGVEKKFGGHGLLLDTGELKAKDKEELKKVTRLHTATHLLQAALRKVLGESVNQAGSDITAERTRFDFTFERKLTDEEIKKVEDLVNSAVNKKYQVEMKEMAYEEAMKLGALSVFSAEGGEKYPPTVKVYSVGDFKADPPEIFSRELCGGPHVKNTSEIGHFKILKQEAVGSGLRRLRATVE